MKSVKLLQFAVVCSFALACMACTQPNGNSSQSSDSTGQPVTPPSLKTVGFIMVNVPYDWWSSPSSANPSLYYNFDLVFDGTIARSDLASAKVYLPNSTSSWSLDLDSFDPADKTLSDTCFYVSAHMRELPIGTMKAQATLTNGTVLEKSFTMGIPGSTTNGNYISVYNADETSTVTYPGPPMAALQRPVISSFGFLSSKIYISFSARDSRIHNGIIWLYSSTGAFIGSSPMFRDGKTGQWFSGLNSGNGLYTGTNASNNAVIANSDVLDVNGKALSATDFNRIVKSRVMVVDGLQYETSTSYSSYDYKAISSMY